QPVQHRQHLGIEWLALLFIESQDVLSLGDERLAADHGRDRARALLALLKKDQVAVGAGEQQAEAALAVVGEIQAALGSAGFFQLQPYKIALRAESAVERSAAEISLAMPIADAHAAAGKRSGVGADLIEEIFDG